MANNSTPIQVGDGNPSPIKHKGPAPDQTYIRHADGFDLSPGGGFCVQYDTLPVTSIDGMNDPLTAPWTLLVNYKPLLFSPDNKQVVIVQSGHLKDNTLYIAGRPTAVHLFFAASPAPIPLNTSKVQVHFDKEASHTHSDREGEESE